MSPSPARRKAPLKAGSRSIGLPSSSHPAPQSLPAYLPAMVIPLTAIDTRAFLVAKMVKNLHACRRSVQCSCSSYLTLCDPMDCSTPGFPVQQQFPELAQTHVHRVGDAIQPSHPLSSPSPAFNLSQHQGLFPMSQFFASVGQSIGVSASGDPGSLPVLGRSPGEGNSNPLQNSCLENPMDRGAWWATVYGVTKSRT